MIPSLVRPLSRARGCIVSNLLRGNHGSNFKQATRTKTQILYRSANLPDWFVNQLRRPFDKFSIILWWWITWRAFREYDELVGPNIPKMSGWTDEELGIPPIDEDP